MTRAPLVVLLVYLPFLPLLPALLGLPESFLDIATAGQTKLVSAFVHRVTAFGETHYLGALGDGETLEELLMSRILERSNPSERIIKRHPELRMCGVFRGNKYVAP